MPKGNEPQFDPDFNLGDQGREDQVYPRQELSPGGGGKQGDQQQMGQDREPRRDKSRDSAGTDKEHLP